MSDMIPIARTFPDAFSRWMAWDRQPAVLLPEPERSFTYADFSNQVAQLAGRLQHVLAAVPADAPVAMAMPNSLEFLACFLALAACGRAVMPLNPGLTADLAAVQLRDGGAGMLLVPAGDLGQAMVAAAMLQIPVRAVSLDAQGLSVNGPAGTAAPPASVGPEAVLLLLQTSGTTGKPKWVPLTHRNILASVEHIMATYSLAPSDTSLLIMPLFHVHGLIGVALATLFSGGGLVVPPKFSASHFRGWARQFRPTWYSAVPTMHQILLARPDLDPPWDPPLRFVRSCSSPLMPRTAADLEQRLQAPVLQAYGMTEAAHQIASHPLPPAPRTAGSVGRPTGVEAAIFDDQGRAVPVGTAGEVVLRGENIMAGYLNNPEANARSFAHGWFRTGDIGQLDAAGGLTLVGRAKEMINRGGEKIAPAQIDAVILEVPGVSQAVAFGVPDPLYGEVVHAAVKGAALADAAAILRHCRARLPAFMVPAQVHLVAEIPTGPTGKISRASLPGLLKL